MTQLGRGARPSAAFRLAPPGCTPTQFVLRRQAPSLAALARTVAGGPGASWATTPPAPRAAPTPPSTTPPRACLQWEQEETRQSPRGRRTSGAVSTNLAPPFHAADQSTEIQASLWATARAGQPHTRQRCSLAPLGPRLTCHFPGNPQQIEAGDGKQIQSAIVVDLLVRGAARIRPKAASEPDIEAVPLSVLVEDALGSNAGPGPWPKARLASALLAGALESIWALARSRTSLSRAEKRLPSWIGSTAHASQAASSSAPSASSPASKSIKMLSGICCTAPARKDRCATLEK